MKRVLLLIGLLLLLVVPLSAYQSAYQQAALLYGYLQTSLGRILAANGAEPAAVDTAGEEATELRDTAIAAEAVITPTIASRPTPVTAAGLIASDELPYYQMRVRLGSILSQVRVQQQVTLTNRSSDPWEEVVFNISPAYWPDVFTLRRAAVTRQEAPAAITPTLNLTMLHVPLTQPLLPQEAVTIEVEFDLNLPQLDPNGWAPNGNAGWSSSLLQMGDWYPILVPYDNGVGWRTWEFTAVGDPVTMGLANYEVTIDAPADHRVAAAGFVGANGTERMYRLEQARSFAFIVSPGFVRYSSEAAGIPVSVYVLAEHQSEGAVVLDTAIAALQLFNELYGPYPYRELVIAENGFLSAMEYSAFISLSGYAFHEYNGTPNSLLVALVVHEVAHQWWYGAVGNDQVREPWLDEGMAMLSELLYYEHFYPATMDWWWNFRAGTWSEPGYVNMSIHDFDNSSTFVRHVYGQAAYLMRDIRAAMGDAGFRAFLRNYYQQNRFQLTNRERFFAAVRAHTPADLTPLLTTYFQE